jgi:hypothetical protein
MRLLAMVSGVLVWGAWCRAWAGEAVPPPDPGKIDRKTCVVIEHVVRDARTEVGSFGYVSYRHTGMAHVITMASKRVSELEPGTSYLVPGTYFSDTAWIITRDDRGVNWYSSGMLSGKRLSVVIRGGLKLFFAAHGKPGKGGGGGGGGGRLEWATMSIDLDLDADTNRNGIENLTDHGRDAGSAAVIGEDKDEDNPETNPIGALVGTGGQSRLLLRGIMPKGVPEGRVTIFTRRARNAAGSWMTPRGAVTVRKPDGSLVGVDTDLWEDVRWDSANDRPSAGIMLGMQGLAPGKVIVVARYESEAVFFEDTCRVTVVPFDLDAEIDGTPPVNDADEDEEESVGAVIVLNRDDDDRDGTVDLDDGEVVQAAGVADSGDENDLKRFTLTLNPDSMGAGELVLRRSNGRIRVYSDPRKGVGAANDRAVLWSATPAGYANNAEGNGVRTFRLPADREALAALVRSGIFVEGAEASADRRDSVLSMAFTPAGATAPALSDAIKVTVLDLRMDFVTELTDLDDGQLQFNPAPGGHRDPVNKLHNPAVVVIESAPQAGNVAILRASVQNDSTGRPIVTADDDFLSWDVASEGGQAAFFVPTAGGASDRTGTQARIYGRNSGRILVTARVKAADAPFINYGPLVAPLKTLDYRFNFLQSTTSTPAIRPADVPEIMGIMNIITRQFGVTMRPDPDIGTDVIMSDTVPAVIPAGTSRVIVAGPNVRRNFCRYAPIVIDDGQSVHRAIVTNTIPPQSIEFSPATTTPIAASASIRWDVAPTTPTGNEAGCRNIDVPDEFVVTQAGTLHYAGILNNREGAVNFNVITSHAAGAAGQLLFLPAVLLADPGTLGQTADFITERAENREFYRMEVLPAPLATNADIGTQALISIVAADSLNDAVRARIASFCCHEMLHGLGIRHRSQGAGSDGVEMAEHVPVQHPPIAFDVDACARQNVMWPWIDPPRRNFDVDALQSPVARTSSLVATNLGGLTIASDAPVVDVAVNGATSQVRFTVTRSGAAVSGALVHFFVKGKDLSGWLRLSTSSTVTDGRGRGFVGLNALGPQGTDQAELRAIAEEGGDTVVGSIQVHVCRIASIGFTNNVNTVVAAGQANATTASATTEPAGLPVQWEIPRPRLGCSIDGNTGVIRAGRTGGTITVKATHVASGATATGTLTLVRVRSVALTPSTIVADGASTSQAVATVQPAGRVLDWSFRNNVSLGCSMSPISGAGPVTVRSGHQAGQVVLVATDHQTGASAEATLTLTAPRP